MTVRKKIYRKILSSDEIAAILGNAVVALHEGPTEGQARSTVLFTVEMKEAKLIVTSARVEVEMRP